MKKSYTKPDIIFESFSLSTDIAGGCEFITNTSGYGECGYEFRPGMNVFIVSANGSEGCHIIVGENEDFNGICYHVPIGEGPLFNS